MSKYLFLLLMVSTSVFGMGSIMYPSISFDITVVDELGKPIEGASISTSSMVAKKEGWGTDDAKMKAVSTDSNGKATISGKGGAIGGMNIRKGGYYDSSNPFEFKEYNKLLNRYEPYPQALTIILRKKKNPVPMYAKKNTGTNLLDLPEKGVDIGYDLEKGDFVAPYGKGAVSDFIFSHTGNYERPEPGQPSYIALDRVYNRDGYLEGKTILKFSNPHDGIIGYSKGSLVYSSFKWPYEVSGEEFEKQYEYYEIDVRDTSKGKKSKTVKNIVENSFIFRVRTKIDAQGNIISACYGKLDKLDFNITKRFEFVYYFNPDGARNLEFDPKKNLFNYNSKKKRFNNKQHRMPEEYNVQAP